MTDWRAETCIVCGVFFAMTKETESVLRHTEATFYCPRGHGQVYRKGPSEADKLRQERDRLKQAMAQKDDAIAALEIERDHERRRVSAARGQVTRLKNRAAAGVCPCCSRHFENLQRHMASKHPEFPAAKQDADNVVPIRA